MKINDVVNIYNGGKALCLDKWPSKQECADFHIWSRTVNIYMYTQVDSLFRDVKDSDELRSVPAIIISSTAGDDVVTLCLLKWA